MKAHLIAASLLLGVPIFAAMAQSPPQAQTEKPRPEIQRVFDAFLGTWSVTEKLDPSETMPNGGTGEGEEIYKRGPGNASFIEEIHLKEGSRNLSGLGVGWWDQQAKGYRTIWCDSENPDGCIVMAHLAKWDGNDFVLGDEFDRDGKRFVFREVFTDITPTSFTQTLYRGEAGKELKKLLTIHASRQSHGASSSDANDKDQMSAESNKALLRRAIDTWSAGDLSAVDEVVAPEYVGHVSTGDRDKQALRQRIEAFHHLYSQMAFHVEDQMADGDKVITRLSADLT